jgi:hypothetical protein
MENLAPATTDQGSQKDASPAPSFAVPSLLFDNRTPFAAAQFDTIDQHGAAFHVFVAKIGYTLGACDDKGLARLTVLDEPTQLNAEDLHEGDDPSASVLQESDYAPFKPRCDVIVNSVAHSPGNKPAKTFSARLMLVAPGKDGVSARALIDKTLIACGPRWFIKKPAIQRIAELPLKIASLGLIRPNAWRLSKPTPITQIPVRYEHALGGQCRIDSDSDAARRVPKKHTLGQITNDGAVHAVAHEACQSNPIGKGFSRTWYLKASKSKRIPAPQLSVAGKDCRSGDFAKGAAGSEFAAPAGFGVIGRAWLPRRALIGKIEEKSNWLPDEIPQLPLDFNHAYWNCAPEDQQCDYLNGSEEFTLMNMCPPASASARIDQTGNTVLRFALPTQAMFVLAATQKSTVSVLPLSLDTVVINTESGRVDLIWRGDLDADGTFTSSRLMHISHAAQMERMNELANLQNNQAQGEQ